MKGDVSVPFNNDNVAASSIDPARGALTLLTGSSIPGGPVPRNIAVYGIRC